MQEIQQTQEKKNRKGMTEEEYIGKAHNSVIKIAGISPREVLIHFSFINDDCCLFLSIIVL